MKRILLMDDEQVVLDFLGQMLTYLGFEVGTSKGGAEAIAAYEKAKAESKPFDVVMMDLVINNGMGGEEAVKELKKIDPAAKVIVSSGYLDHPAILDHRAFSFNGVITKPYKIDKLKEAIESVINAPA